MTTKTVLITGANGLLGQKLVSLYREIPQIKLVATSLGNNRNELESGYVYRQLDITVEQEIERIFSEFKPDVLINAAAMTNVDACETEKDTAMALNVTAVKYLSEACSKYGTHMIHISTDFIFNGTRKMYTEQDKPDPLSYYGWSKWEGEKMVMENAKNWTIVRTIIVYGIGHNLSRLNTVLWAFNVLKDHSPARVVDDQYRTPTLAEDLAQGCRLIEQKQAFGIFNIAGKDYMNIYELVLKIARHFRFPTDNISVISTDSLNQPAKRPPITGLNIEKARRELNYEPHSFEDALDIFYLQYQKEFHQ